MNTDNPIYKRWMELQEENAQLRRERNEARQCVLEKKCDYDKLHVDWMLKKHQLAQAEAKLKKESEFRERLANRHHRLQDVCNEYRAHFSNYKSQLEQVRLQVKVARDLADYRYRQDRLELARVIVSDLDKALAILKQLAPTAWDGDKPE